MQETWVWSLGQKDPLEEERATHSSILAGASHGQEETGKLQSMGSQGAGHDWATNLSPSQFWILLLPKRPDTEVPASFLVSKICASIFYRWEKPKFRGVEKTAYLISKRLGKLITYSDRGAYLTVTAKLRLNERQGTIMKDLESNGVILESWLVYYLQDCTCLTCFSCFLPLKWGKYQR